MHIIEDDENSYCKSTNPLKDKTLRDQPRKVNMDLAQEMVSPQQHWDIPVVKLTQDEEGMSDEVLLPKILSACLYAKATKNPWRGKQNISNEHQATT